MKNDVFHCLRFQQIRATRQRTRSTDIVDCRYDVSSMYRDASKTTSCRDEATMCRHVLLASSRVASQVMKSDAGLDDCDVAVVDAETAVDNGVAVVVVVGADTLTTCCPNHSVTRKEKLVAIGVTNLYRADDDQGN